MLLYTILKKLKMATEGVTVTPEGVVKKKFYYAKKIKLYVFSTFLQLKILKGFYDFFTAKHFEKNKTIKNVKKWFY